MQTTVFLSMEMQKKLSGKYSQWQQKRKIAPKKDDLRWCNSNGVWQYVIDQSFIEAVRDEQQHSHIATQSLIAESHEWCHTSSGLQGALGIWLIWPQQPMKQQQQWRDADTWVFGDEKGRWKRDFTFSWFIWFLLYLSLWNLYILPMSNWRCHCNV